MIRTIDSTEHYEIVKLIAEGGMGAVYKARKIGVSGFEKTVAIKMLLGKFSADPAFVENFIAEAKLVANLIHENIVQIYQLSKCAEGYYFVLEFVDGISLFDFVEMHRRIKQRVPLALAVFIAARIARGLAYAHSRRDGNGRSMGIVHCDVCPHNVLINTEGVPKITDFGIARSALNHFDGRVSGKLAFMAPEQAFRQEIDFRADIYSLGVVLFYLVSNEMARDLKQEPAAILQNIRANVIRREALPADVPGEIVDLLHRMLATDPAQRYSDTNELARDLEYFIYRDGYGPTIVTLAEYLKKLLPGRFGSGAENAGAGTDADRTMVLTDADRTTVLNFDD